MWYVRFLFLTLLLPSCTALYHKKQFRPLSIKPHHHIQHNDIELSVAPLTKKDANILFDNRGGRLIRKRNPIRILYVDVINRREHPISIHPKEISLKLMDVRSIAHRLHSHPKRRLVTLITLSALAITVGYISAAYLALIGAICQNSALVKAGYGVLAAVGACVLVTPAACYMHTKQARATNTLIDADVQEKVLHHELIINTHEEKPFLLCTRKKEFSPHFSMTFIDTITLEPLEFHIDLDKKRHV